MLRFIRAINTWVISVSDKYVAPGVPYRVESLSNWTPTLIGCIATPPSISLSSSSFGCNISFYSQSTSSSSFSPPPPATLPRAFRDQCLWIKRHSFLLLSMFSFFLMKYSTRSEMSVISSCNCICELSDFFFPVGFEFLRKICRENWNFWICRAKFECLNLIGNIWMCEYAAEIQIFFFAA